MTNYILEYYQNIKDGSIVAGQWIIKWYEYIIRGLEERRFFYAPKKAERVLKFAETFARHHEGPLAPGYVKLELWQKALLSVVFAIVDENGVRQFREIFIQMGRKQGKTLLAAIISEYCLFMDGEYGARIYYCAPKLDQSRLCFNAFQQMLMKEPELSALAKKRRTDVYVAATNSSAQPLAFSYQRSDGLNPSLTICDEIASWAGEPGLKQYEVLKSALGARKQPLLISISTAGFCNDSIFDELVKRSTAVLQGTSRETRLCPFLYMIDDPDKWNDINELKKANPNLGISVSVDYMLDEIAIAEGSLSKLVEFKVKYCNVKQNSSTAWLASHDIKKSFPPNHYTLDDFRGCYALGGIDLSMTTDLTAACVLIERGGTLYYFTHFWLPESKLAEATARDGLPYDTYIKRGFLTLAGENVVDYNAVYQWFVDFIEEKQIYILQLGYDRYSSQYLVQTLDAYGFHTESVTQGTNLTGIINDCEGMIKDGRLQCGDDNDLMKIHLLDSALKIDTDTNRRKLVKISKNAHVDGTAALLDALCMRHNHFEELADQLRN